MGAYNRQLEDTDKQVEQAEAALAELSPHSRRSRIGRRLDMRIELLDATRETVITQLRELINKSNNCVSLGPRGTTPSPCPSITSSSAASSSGSGAPVRCRAAPPSALRPPPPEEDRGDYDDDDEEDSEDEDADERELEAVLGHRA